MDRSALRFSRTVMQLGPRVPGLSSYTFGPNLKGREIGKSGEIGHFDPTSRLGKSGNRVEGNREIDEKTIQGKSGNRIGEIGKSIKRSRGNREIE